MNNNFYFYIYKYLKYIYKYNKEDYVGFRWIRNAILGIRTD